MNITLGLRLLFLVAGTADFHVANSQIAHDPVLRVVGAAETVIPAEAMNCNKPGAIDVPDILPTAFRRTNGDVVLLASNRQNFYAIGRSLDQVRRESCSSMIPSAQRADPAEFADNEWLAALYVLPDSRVLGFVHDEFHGARHNLPGCMTGGGPETGCWYAATTIVVSNDDGRSFSRPKSPGNVVAALPYRFAPAPRRASMGTPKVVGNPNDGYIYLFVTHFDQNKKISPRQCLLRASESKPFEWEGWDGTGYSLNLGSPYASRSLKDCTPVLSGNLSSVKYLPKYHKFLAISLEGDQVLYRFSNTLTDWSEPKKLFDGFVSVRSFKQGNGKSNPQPLVYFSLLDPTSNSRNFDTLEKRPYLYFVRFRTNANGLDGSHRDVMRMPLELQ